MNVPCKKCPYFDPKNKDAVSKGSIIKGFCKLRQKFISDETINKEFCKDRAVIS